MGTHHFLLGLLQQHDSVAAKALESLGVSPESLQQRVAEIDPAGTSDETPEQAGARRVGMRVEGKLVMLEIDDPALAASLEEAMSGRKVRVIKGTDPEAEGAGFTTLWSSVARSIEDLTRRLGKATGVRPATPNPAAYWRPPALDDMTSAARYWIVNMADGPSGYLEVGPGSDRERVRAWLLEHMRDWRPSVVESWGSNAALWLALNGAGDGFVITTYGFGSGPAGSMAIAPAALVDAAIADLSAVA